MAWQDRDYNRSYGGGDYLGNPAAWLNYSIPCGTWFGVRVRLHFWLLLTIAFGVATMLGSPLWCAVGVGLLLLALLVHDFTHKAVATWLGGTHNDFMLWPAGGMSFPNIPPGAWPMFATYSGPIVVHSVLAIGCMLAIRAPLADLPLNPLYGLDWHVVAPQRTWLQGSLFAFAIDNWMLVLCNILPYYWFDGGSLWQSILWPMTGAYQALNVVCIGGMVLAAPMMLLSLMGGGFLALVFWALLFASSYTRWRQLRTEGAHDLDDVISFNAQNPFRDTGARGRKWFQPGLAKKAAKRNAEIRREREKIDQILAKVSRSGMNSLTWFERRTLRKATERQKHG